MTRWWGGLFERAEKFVIFALVGTQTRMRWWREEVLLADSFEMDRQTPERITMFKNGSLQVLNVQREDSGEYVCQAIRPSPWGHITQVHEIEVMCEYDNSIADTDVCRDKASLSRV